jgi:hypothetical protein
MQLLHAILTNLGAPVLVVELDEPYYLVQIYIILLEAQMV